MLGNSLTRENILDKENTEHAENHSLDSDLILNNPYNLTEIEKERLKEKNHLLISQFQNAAYRQYPYFLASQYGAGSNRADNDSIPMSSSLRFG